MRTLAVTPIANNTEVALKPTWPHPSFGGSYLPRTRTIDEKASARNGWKQS